MEKVKTIYVCQACGKRSHDLYGERPIDLGWDISCTMSAVEALESHLLIDPHTNRVTAIQPGGIQPAQ